MKNIGWIIKNGSGRNDHKTARVLIDMLASDPSKLPQVPDGYGVLVAPISDKPLGLRCALVRLCERKIEPFVDFYNASGSHIFPAARNWIMERIKRWPTGEEQLICLVAMGYVKTHLQRRNWCSSAREWYLHADGTWASVDMLDAGPVGEPSEWVKDRFGFDGEIIYICYCIHEYDNESKYFTCAMSAVIGLSNRPIKV
jgi:hypothetical protein